MDNFNREDMIEGRNPVLEAIKSGREIDKILIQKGKLEGSIVRIIKDARKEKIVIQEVSRVKLDNLSYTKAHQGIIAFTSMHKYYTIDEILDDAKEKGESPFILIADEITDPHNLGSILRTADCSGAHGVIIPKRRAVGLNATVSKTSAGAIEYVKVCKVSNISNAIKELKDKGVWIIGADMGGNRNHYEEDFKIPIALVIGSEGSGIPRLVKENCDLLVKIPMKGKISSLNASVAASVLMYNDLRQR